MKLYEATEVAAGSEATRHIANVLSEGRLACVPCGGSYRLICDALDPEAVMSLMMVKRRSGHAPSLIFVPDEAGLETISDEVPQELRTLARKHWPGEVTILVRPSDILPGRVRKQLTKANKHLGVRVPKSPEMQAVARAFGGPILASSANRASKKGANSAAVVRKLFGTHLDVFVDAGELTPQPASTVVSLERGGLKIRREGAISGELLRAALA